MEILNIDKTKYTPQINLNPYTGILDISGDSFPENSFEYYENIEEWLSEYFKSPQEFTTVNLELSYLNSSSFKVFFDIFNIFVLALKNGKDFEINWIYDEENDISGEMGEDFQLEFENLNIKLIVKNTLL